jgi:lipopolysaccharide/colanic/teichoic acid biosynthesis glycosyltransferase
VLPLILDYGLPYLCPPSADISLLTLPVGSRPFIDHIIERLGFATAAKQREVLVLPTFPVGDDYARRLQHSTFSQVRILHAEELDTVVADCESEDFLALVDPAWWPATAASFTELLERGAEYRAATHVVALGGRREGVRECVEQDGEGHVRRVQRLYDGVTWPEVGSTGVFLSMVPARLLHGVCFTTLMELRAALSARGLLSRDLPLALDTLDLTCAEGVLAFNEQVLEQQAGAAPPDGYRVEQANVLVGQDCQIHPTARLVGPVILQHGVTVDARAIIVGPAVIGSNSRIQADAMVAQAVLAAGTVLSPGTTVRHSVAAGSCDACTAEAPRGPEQTCRMNGALPVFGAATRRAGTGAPRQARGRRVQQAVKRLADVVLSLLGLLVLAPVLLVTAVLVKVTSPGPVFFIHRREQRGGKVFGCLKFRTMTADAHLLQRALYQNNNVDGPQFKLWHDPRVTRLGKLLRRTNVDELPQLLNVLAGHMSLVGPRPSPFRENQICVPWRRARLSVRPGLTGLWQLCRSPDRSAGDFHEWIFYDIAYVRHFSLWLDIKILVLTVLTGGRKSIPMSWLIRGSSGGPESGEQPVAA